MSFSHRTHGLASRRPLQRVAVETNLVARSLPQRACRIVGKWVATRGMVCTMLVVAIGCVPLTAQADWSIAPRGAVALNVSAVSNVAEMSGVASLGLVEGQHRFTAVQDSGNQLVHFSASFAGDGTLQSAVAIDTLALAPGFDFEGVAYTHSTRNSVWVSEESTPAVREYSLTTGMQLQLLSPPAVFASQVGNRGLESLARSIGGNTLWTANEEALTIDGNLATDTTGTVVRLQQFAAAGDGYVAAAQFAYQVDPVHTGSPNRSGLSDLVALPDGSVLALERSLGGITFESRLYQIDFHGATDISGSIFDTGLMDAAYLPVAKRLLWSGQAGGGLGQNLEGLTLGPQLGDGSWLLLGVVDSGDPLSGNTVVAFAATAPACSLAGDYNCSGAVDAMDLTTWRESFGSSQLLFADGNADGVVNLADYTLWRDHLGASGVPIAAASAVPEPPALVSCVVLAALAVLWLQMPGQRAAR